MVNQEKLLKEISSLSDSIRRKNRALRLGISERDKFLENTFKPVTEPLKQLTKNINRITPPFAGDNLLPISKYEKEQLQHKEFEDVGTSEETEESEEYNESEESEGIREKEDVSAQEDEDEDETMNPSNISKLGTEIIFKGELGRKYLLKMLHSTPANRNYHVYGARLEGSGLMVGDSKLDVDENNSILIGNNKYKGTAGLFELIFKNNPGKHTKKDLEVFKSILIETNAHKKRYLENSPIHRNQSLKYRNIISNLFKSQVKRRAMSSAELNIKHKSRKITNISGKGLMKNSYDTNVIYYNDINKLVDRMKLIREAMEAGHTGLENEWVALIDELRNKRIII